MDLLGPLAVEVDRPDGAEGDGVVQQADAVVLGDGEHVEVPVVGRPGDGQVVELLAVLVNVLRQPAPVAVAVVVIGVSELN